MMCAICPYCIAKDPCYCSMTAKELDELLTAPTERDIFVTQRGQCIDRKNVTGRQASPSAVVKANTVIQAMTADKVQYRKVLGNVWPIQVYKREKGIDPPRKLVHTHIISGQKIRGITMPPSEGEPVGCYSMAALSETGV